MSGRAVVREKLRLWRAGVGEIVRNGDREKWRGEKGSKRNRKRKGMRDNQRRGVRENMGNRNAMDGRKGRQGGRETRRTGERE